MLVLGIFLSQDSRWVAEKSSCVNSGLRGHLQGREDDAFWSGGGLPFAPQFFHGEIGAALLLK